MQSFLQNTLFGFPPVAHVHQAFEQVDRTAIQTPDPVLRAGSQCFREDMHGLVPFTKFRLDNRFEPDKLTIVNPSCSGWVIVAGTIEVERTGLLKATYRVSVLLLLRQGMSATSQKQRFHART